MNGTSYYNREYLSKIGELEWVERAYGNKKINNAHNSYLALLSRHGTIFGGYFIFFMLVLFPYIFIREYRKFDKEKRIKLLVIIYAVFSFYISCLTENVISARTANLYVLMLALFSFFIMDDEKSYYNSDKKKEEF